MLIFEDFVVKERQRKVAESLGNSGPVVVVGAGDPITKPGGLDQTYPYLPYPEYYWLSGSRRPGGILVYIPESGWKHFVRQVSMSERLWEGTPEIPKGEDLDSFENFIKKYSNRSIVVLGDVSNSFLSSKQKDVASEELIKEKISCIRRRKDFAELELMQRAVKATAAGFKKAREIIRPGVTERKIQIEMEAEMMRSGADGTSFGTIVGAGTNSAVLHFAPSNRTVEKDDLVLVDSGAEIFDYCADVTRTFPAGDRFSPKQQAIYDIVLAAEQEGIMKCRPGTEWHDIHRVCAAIIGQGLIDIGILKGSLNELLETNVVALFFPHGFGHMVGHRVRDVGGRAHGRSEGQLYCGARLRVDLPLEENFVMTVEPGIYFVSAILDDADLRIKHKNTIDWNEVRKWRSVGGIRIEDDVLITSQGPKVLTAEIPK